MQEDSFADSLDILKFEETRQKLRSLIRLIPKGKADRRDKPDKSCVKASRRRES